MEHFLKLCQRIQDLCNRLFEQLFAVLMFRVRLLPIVIFCASVLLSLKVVSLKDNVDRYALEIEASRAVASETEDTAREQQANKQSNLPNGTDPAPTTSASAQQPSTTPNAVPSPDVTKLDPSTLSPEAFQAMRQAAEARQKQAALQAQAEQTGPQTMASPANAANQQTAPVHNTPSQVDPVKQATAQSLEAKLQKKVEELQKAEQKLTDLMNKIDEEENVNTKRLVKMAEAMPPKEAAAILEGLEFSVLLELMERIKEAKASAILASMEPQKASYLMTELAKRKKVFKKDNPDQSTTTSPN
ncbi:MAG: magnesium transporter MgtE N-terminal domain-containing protein [Holosporales bacterium]